jgi:hypothetical protein
MRRRSRDQTFLEKRLNLFAVHSSKLQLASQDVISQQPYLRAHVGLSEFLT